MEITVLKRTSLVMASILWAILSAIYLYNKCLNIPNYKLEIIKYDNMFVVFFTTFTIAYIIEIQNFTLAKKQDYNLVRKESGKSFCWVKLLIVSSLLYLLTGLAENFIVYKIEKGVVQSCYFINHITTTKFSLAFIIIISVVLIDYFNFRRGWQIFNGIIISLMIMLITSLLVLLKYNLDKIISCLKTLC